VRSATIALSRGQALYNWGPYCHGDCFELHGIHFSVPGPIKRITPLNGPPENVYACQNAGKCGPIPRNLAQTDGSSCDGATSCFAWYSERTSQLPAAYTLSVDYTLTHVGAEGGSTEFARATSSGCASIVQGCPVRPIQRRNMSCCSGPKWRSSGVTYRIAPCRCCPLYQAAKAVIQRLAHAGDDRISRDLWAETVPTAGNTVLEAFG
jgi:hypothetical protein